MTTAMLPPRPTVDEPVYNFIPMEVKRLNQWVFWLYQLRQKSNGQQDWTKVPFGYGSNVTPTEARANAPKTWLPFNSAKDWFKKYSHGSDGGIGFEFHPDGPYFGIDL